MKHSATILTAVTLLLPLTTSRLGAAQQISTLTSRVYSVNVSGASAENVIRMIAQKAGVPVQIDGDLSKRVSYNFTDTTLENALSRMASDVGFEYSLRDNMLVVSKGGKSASASSTPHLIEMKFVEAEEMSQRLSTLLGEGETTYVDKKLNNVVLMSSEATYQRALKFIELFDRMPKQILIETTIVETNNTFARDLGFQLGDVTDPTTALNQAPKATAYSTPAVSKTPFFGGKYRFGLLNSRALDIRLIAAESKGDAKVVSRPKVVTINNMRATVNSGLEFNVKTLSSTPSGAAASDGSSGSGTTSGVVTGGLEKVTAGLELGVLPTILDNDKVRLLVDVDNSEPDNTASVDSIPGITRNKANTSLIVLNGETAVIAGLIKQRKSSTRTGVPFLSSIPVLGLLFRNDSQSDRNNELMIFITPRIMEKVENAVALQESSSKHE